MINNKLKPVEYHYIFFIKIIKDTAFGKIGNRIVSTLVRLRGEYFNPHFKNDYL